MSSEEDFVDDEYIESENDPFSVEVVSEDDMIYSKDNDVVDVVVFV